MQNVEVKPAFLSSQLNKLLVIAVILVILAVTGVIAYKTVSSASVKSLPSAGQLVTEGELSEQYGLGVNLIAVTAAGGMVDLRLNIVDAEKAKTFLEDKANFPKLQVEDGNVLQISDDIASQPIEFENGKSIFILYPNAQNAVKPGDPVTIIMGDVQVEAIQSK